MSKRPITRPGRAVGGGGALTTATERMEAARKVKAEAISRELVWAAAASRLMTMWDCKLMKPRVEQENFPCLLVLDTPVGRMVYRLTEEEWKQFRKDGLADHLGPIQENDGKQADDKFLVLAQLAQGVAV